MIPHIKRINSTTKHAKSKLFVITLNPAHENNAGLIAHELEHVKQWWLGVMMGLLIGGALWLSGYQAYGYFTLITGICAKDALYTLSSKMRMIMEVDAHRAQLRHGHDSIEFLAEWLSTHYGFDLTYEQALDKLRG